MAPSRHPEYHWDAQLPFDPELEHGSAEKYHCRPRKQSYQRICRGTAVFHCRFQYSAGTNPKRIGDGGVRLTASRKKDNFGKVQGELAKKWRFGSLK